VSDTSDSIGKAVLAARAAHPASIVVNGWRLTYMGQADVPSITCPRCGMTSYNPHDIEDGFCGNCHAWTNGVVRP
jgi:hypothetical protein